MGASVGAHEAVTWQPIAARLKRIGARGAGVARIAYDERFQRWLGHVLEDPALAITVRPLRPPISLIEVEADQGRMRIAMEEEAVPPALQMAMRMPDRRVACDVATALLQDQLERFAPVLTGARVGALARSDRRHSGFAITVQGRRLVLCGADESVTAHVGTVLREIPPSLIEWGALAVRPRLRLMVRRWRAGFVASLAPGDVVLLGRDQRKRTLIVGTGFSMQADAEMSMSEDMVEVVGDVSMSSDDPGGLEAPDAQVEALELPVAFEIDTARVGLAELASMRPGYVVELDTALAEAMVRLVCHGQTIGHGQLIAVGEQLGVRITRMGREPARGSSGA
ncbi:MAG TPA: FliM/FliN family flagellar motor switch protein [Albitalea sp.]|uniref:FliM/FliN family flagellar motor switch protein n=1 Tax=Piscinibacter sp. TaxID=1903157 RepID=UPI002ED39F89